GPIAARDGHSPPSSVGMRQTSTIRAVDVEMAAPGRPWGRLAEMVPPVGANVSTCRQPKAQAASTVAAAIQARTKIMLFSDACTRGILRRIGKQRKIKQRYWMFSM